MTDRDEKPLVGSSGESAGAEAAGGSSFPATQWSLVLRAGSHNGTQAHDALESLCRRYWYPLYTFARRQGRNHHEAEDCTQEFLAQLLAADGLLRARPDRGRFRTFLLSGLRNFLVSEWRRTNAAKRGGGLEPLSLACSGAAEQFSLEPQDTALTSEQAFDRSWALGLIDRAVEELRAEYETGGRTKVFEAMAPLIWGAENSDSLVRRAAELGLNLNSFTVALHRARRRLGDRLRALVAETVANPAEIDAELRYLVSAISGANPPR